jgi:multisubunit Na+/H+ antiporter MnhC subunit
MMEQMGSQAMPIATIFIVTGIIFGFAAFAVALAWGEYQTRNIGRSGEQHSRISVQVHSLKKIAQDVAPKSPASEKADHLG